MGGRCSRASSSSAATAGSLADADIIFLDIDGVLNNRSSREDGDHLPTADLLDNLRFCVSVSTIIVLSSTWRLDSTLRLPLIETLKSVGLSVHSSTPDLEKLHTGDRVDEIICWLREHDHSASAPWVAIDDLDLLAMNPKMQSAHFVRTLDGTGLTRANAEEVIFKLRQLRSSADEPMRSSSETELCARSKFGLPARLR